MIKLDTLKKNIVLMPFNILYKLSPSLELKILFRLKQGYKLDLKNPKTYNEKIQWIKLNDKNNLMPICVDKYTVREYVKNKKCANLLNNILWEGSNPDDIPFDSLPQKFVIKVTHGSTFNIICNSKKELDVKKTKRDLKKWLKQKFIPCYGEWFYGIIKPRIIVENFIESKNGLKDYKIFCFNGKAEYIAVYSDRQNGKTTQEIYDTDWNLINEHTNKFNLPTKLTAKPEKLNEMIKYAEILSKDFYHARIDFFYENNKIIFGEITFTSSAGFGKFSSRKFELEMGSKLTLPIKEK